MRCLTIADNLKEDVIFITRSLEAKKKLEEKKYKTFLAKGNYRNLIFDETIYDLIFQYQIIDLCIVDSYYVNHTFFRQLKKHMKVLYIDDLNKERWNVDYLLNSNLSAFHQNYYEIYKNSETKIFLGPKYLMLRDEFFKCTPIKINEEVSNVFISSGGSDSCGSILKILNTLIKSNVEKKIKYHVLVGRLNNSIKELREIESNNDFIKIYYDVNNVARIMEKCDIAIAAAGNTLYELSYLGIPTLAYTIAENQVFGASVFEKHNLIVSIGGMDSKFETCLKKSFDKLLKDFNSRLCYHKTMCEIMIDCKKKILIKEINDIVKRR